MTKPVNKPVLKKVPNQEKAVPVPVAKALRAQAAQAIPAYMLTPEQDQVLQGYAARIAQKDAQIVQQIGALYGERDVLIRERMQVCNDICISFGADLTTENWNVDFGRKTVMRTGVVAPAKAPAPGQPVKK